MNREEVKSELETLIQQRRFSTARGHLMNYEPSELSGLMDVLDSANSIIVFRLIPAETAALMFKYLSRDNREMLIESLAADEDRLSTLLNDLSPDDRTAFFAELPEEQLQSFLDILEPKARKNAIQLLSYPEESIGRLTTTDYIALRSDWTVEQALRHVRRFGNNSETIDVIYIVDQDWRLLDDLRLREVLLADPDTRIEELMDYRFVSLTATDDQETAVRVFKEYDRAALPVVDPGGLLVGILTFDDALDVAEVEATEDMQKLGGLEALESPYMETSLFTLIKKRAGWLAILFVGEMLTASAMGYFEEELAQAVVLGLFLPLIISSGGNSGSQAASLIIRALAVGEVSLKDWWRVTHRELFSGLALGTLLGVMGFCRVIVWALVFNLYGEHWLQLGLTVGVTLVGVVTWGTLAGSMLPFIIKRFGADPAVSSAPFVATLVDVTGLIIYFSVAALILSGTLL